MSELQLDYNDILRGGVIKLIGTINVEGIPVGSVLGAIIGLVWPETDRSEEVWASVKKYALKMTKQEIDRERIDLLSKRLDGFKSIATAYLNTSFGSPQKGQHLTNLLDNLRLFERDFWDGRNPVKMFPLFSVYGTLWISALLEQAFLYEKVYGVPDPDAAKHLKEYRDNVEKYTRGAQVMFDTLYAWRFTQLEIQEILSGRLVLLGWAYGSEWKVIDRYDNFSQSVGGEDLNNSTYHNPSGRTLIERVAAERVASINNGFVQELQQILSVTQLWRYMEPNGIRPLKQYVVSNEGPWGGDINLGGDFVDRIAGPSARITSIRMRTGAFIDYLEVFHDGQSGGGHGNGGGGSLKELNLEKDEYVVEVSGRSSSLIDHLKFTTNKGHSIEGGDSSSGKDFLARGRSDWNNVTLFAVNGRSDGNRITGLTLQWKHLSETPAYVPSYKQSHDELTSSTGFHLKAADGRLVSNLDNKYESNAASNEYFPTMGTTPVVLQFRTAAGTDRKPLANKEVVRLQTSEAAAGDYSFLGKFKSSWVYYYRDGYGDKQSWEVIKVIPSDGAILWSEKIYLRNVDSGTYLCPGGDQYLQQSDEPYPWEVVRQS